MDLMKKDFFDDKEFDSMMGPMGGMGSMGAMGGGRLIPTRFFDLNFFDRQRSAFKDHKDLNKFFDDDFGKFDSELMRWRDNDMFKIDNKPLFDVQQPFSQDLMGNKQFSLVVNCSEYKPENIQIKTVDNMLTVHAKFEEKKEGSYRCKEFTKSYSLPKAVDPLKLTSSLSNDGVLRIEAPAPPEIKTYRTEKFIPIELLAKVK